MEETDYKITYFENKSQSIKVKEFTGSSAYDDAVKWGRENLENFNHDLIQSF